jgi:hypothetical protein
MSINEGFILSIFRKMVQFKPKLAMLLPDDENEDDDFDIRKLANEITANYPWPIGVELRRLLSASMHQLDHARLDQIFRTLERTMQFLTFVLVCQLAEERIQNRVPIPTKFRNEFSQRFAVLTMGNFAWLIRSVGKIFTANNIRPFIPETSGILNKEFYDKLDFWTPERNEIGHYRITLRDEEIEVRCVEYFKKLEEIIAELAFLIKYPLLTITQIEVLKSKREPARFKHHMLMLNSASSDFSGRSQPFDRYTDSHSVLLVAGIKNVPDQYLSLSPLVVDTHFEIIDSREKLSKVKKDIYLCTMWNEKSRHLHYIGTEAEEKPDLRILSFYDQLVREFEEIMQSFSPEA